MIEKFPTYEAAAFYAARKREEGHFAEICDEGSGFLWGPIATKGFRVIVSEYAVGEDETPPTESPEGTESRLDVIIRNAVVVLFGFAGVVMLVLIAKELEHKSVTFNPGLIILPVILAIVSVFGIFIGRFVRRLFTVADDDNRHLLGLLAKIIIALLALTLVLLTLMFYG